MAGLGVIGFLDCSTGVSGDKFLGALLDAGEDGARFTADHLRDSITSLVGEAEVTVRKVQSCGVTAVSVSVRTPEAGPSRSWADIRSLIEGASLPAGVAERALLTFEHLARAEACVHGCDPEEVHFHEVGAADSIVDVVGACLGMHALGIERLTASTVAVGAGTVSASHGVLPVPTPATSELLIGVPTMAGPEGLDGPLGELTTPTGAALLRTCCDGFGSWPLMVPRAVGYGAGARDIGAPNVCRLVLGEPLQLVALESEAVSVLETNVDHVSGEAISFAAGQLLHAGALDAWVSPILMKKGRPSFLLSALAPTSIAEKIAEAMVALTGTLGVRRTDIERYVSERRSYERETPYGRVRFKSGPAGERPEADEVARLAHKHGRDFTSMLRELEASDTERAGTD